MWQLLKWLWERAWKVYFWFDTFYAKAVESVRKAYDWAWQAAWDIYSKASALAWSLYDWLKAFIWTLHDHVKILIWGSVEAAKALVSKWVAQGKVYAGSLFRALSGTLSSTFAWLQRNTSLLISGLRASLTVALQTVKADLVRQLKPLLILFPKLTEITTVLTPRALTRLATLARNYFHFITLFADNPLGFLYGIIRKTFVTFLCYALAYGLGTEEATLPPWPSWGFAGGGDGVPPGIEPPADAGKLGKPVIPLYVSGYVFRPGHLAVDFGLTIGQPVYACHDGVVEITKLGGRGYGHYLTIRGTDWWTLYAHLFRIDVHPGQTVKAGEVVALGDDTGFSTGPHLHLEVRYKGQFVDPLLVIEM